MYTPGATAPFTFSVPQCWHVRLYQATSQNGLAVLYTDQDGKLRLTSYAPSGSGFAAKSSAALPDVDGYKNFKVDSPYGSSYLPMWLQSDVNGNILLVREYQWQSGDNTLSGWQFTLQAASLNVVSEYDTSAFAFKQTDRFARIANWALAKDRLYISVGYCTSVDPYQCGTQSVMLYAVRMARANMDYPRGTVLGTTATTPSCKNVTLVGVRGSGEDPFLHEGLGTTLLHVKDRMIAAGFTSMEVISTPYPATPVDYAAPTYPADYANSVLDGTDSLAGILTQINKDCPNTRVVVIAYSQGTHVADAIRYMPSAIQTQAKALVLFGDPLFNPTLTSVNKGTFSASLYGVWAAPDGPGHLQPRQFSSEMSGKVASYCLAGDIVCNYSPSSIASCGTKPTTCPHVLYATNWTQQAATWIRSKVTP